MGDCGVRTQVGGPGVDEERYEKGEDEDGQDGQQHMQGRPLRLQSVIRKRNQGYQLVLIRAHVDPPLAPARGTVDEDRLLRLIGIPVELLVAPETLQGVQGYRHLNTNLSGGTI